MFLDAVRNSQSAYHTGVFYNTRSCIVILSFYTPVFRRPDALRSADIVILHVYNIHIRIHFVYILAVRNHIRTFFPLYRARGTRQRFIQGAPKKQPLRVVVRIQLNTYSPRRPSSWRWYPAEWSGGQAKKNRFSKFYFEFLHIPLPFKCDWHAIRKFRNDPMVIQSNR